MNLSQLSPDTIAFLGTLLISGATWLYRKAKGDKQASFKDALWGVLDGVVEKLSDSDFVVDTVRAKLTKAANDGMKRMGIKPSAMSALVVSQLVERGISEVRKRVAARKKLEAELMAMLNKATDTPRVFTPVVVSP